MRYIMLDHGGVLSGEPYEGDIDALSQDDLVLSEIYPGASMVLRDGVKILNCLSDLVSNHECKLVFHSKNRGPEQCLLWEQISTAAREKGIAIPEVYAMAVYDVNRYPDNTPENPLIDLTTSNSMIVGYGQGERNGKACVRQALSVALAIDETSRSDCTVFDDGNSVIEVARLEGYQAYLIGGGTHAASFSTAIECLYTQITETPRSCFSIQRQEGDWSQDRRTIARAYQLRLSNK